MPLLLALIALLLTAADHWTTYLCLRAPVPGWEVREANPIAERLFADLGLVPGIAADSLVTLLAIAFLLGTRLIPRTAKSALLIAIAGWTGYAVANNLNALKAMGLSLTGGA